MNYSDPATEVLPWTGLSLVVALAGLFVLIAFPSSERAQASPNRIGQDQELQLVRALSDLRRAVVAYRAEHGSWPAAGTGAGDPWGDWYARNVSKDAREGPAGRLAVLPLAPWFGEAGLPVNAANGLRTVRVLAPSERMPSAPDDSSGWLYDPSTGELRANAEGRLRDSERRVFDL